MNIFNVRNSRIILKLLIKLLTSQHTFFSLSNLIKIFKLQETLRSCVTKATLSITFIRACDFYSRRGEEIFETPLTRTYNASTCTRFYAKFSVCLSSVAGFVASRRRRDSSRMIRVHVSTQALSDFNRSQQLGNCRKLTSGSQMRARRVCGGTRGYVQITYVIHIRLRESPRTRIAACRCTEIWIEEWLKRKGRTNESVIWFEKYLKYKHQSWSYPENLNIR